MVGEVVEVLVVVVLVIVEDIEEKDEVIVFLDEKIVGEVVDFIEV